jgi:hypothetical protein
MGASRVARLGRDTSDGAPGQQGLRHPGRAGLKDLNLSHIVRPAAVASTPNLSTTDQTVWIPFR